LAAKQGWRFDATYDHKDASGNPENPMYSPSPLEQYDSLSLSLSLSPIVCGNE